MSQDSESANCKDRSRGGKKRIHSDCRKVTIDVLCSEFSNSKLNQGINRQRNPSNLINFPTVVESDMNNNSQVLSAEVMPDITHIEGAICPCATREDLHLHLYLLSLKP